MVLKISNKLYVPDPQPAFIRFLNDNYTIPNPEYITRVRLNKWLGGTPKTLKLYQANADDSVSIPYGCLREVFLWLKQNDPDLQVEVSLNRNKNADWSGAELKLRDYQDEAVKYMLNSRFGILKAPCSSGKTIMGHALARMTGKKTLWLTHTKELLNQSKAIGELMLEDSKKVGTITDGKINIGDTITYATVQTMVKYPMNLFEKEFDCVIVDECHRANTKKSSSQFSMVINSIAAEYKFGLSATPETFDGYAKTVLANIGNIRWVIDKDDLESLNTIMPVKIKPVFTEWYYPPQAWRSNDTLDFQVAVSLMAQDPDRNKMIVGLLQDRPTIVLSNNIDMLCHIMNELSPEQQEKACLVSTKHDKEVLKAKVLCSHTDKARAEYIEMMRDGKLDYIFATYQLAKEGLNIPRLEQVVMAFPAVNPNIITQVIGRVARTCDGKKEAVCYDLVDRPAYFQKAFKKRLTLYKKQGNEVIR